MSELSQGEGQRDVDVRKVMHWLMVEDLSLIVAIDSEGWNLLER